MRASGRRFAAAIAAIAAAAVLLLAAAPAIDAAEDGSSRAGSGALPGLVTESGSPDARSSLEKLAITVVGALAVLLGALVLYRRCFPSRGRLRGAGWVHVVDRAVLTPRHAVYVVRVGQRLLALGVAGERLTPLADLGEERGLRGGGSLLVSDRAGARHDLEALGQLSAGGAVSAPLGLDRASAAPAPAGSSRLDPPAWWSQPDSGRSAAS